MTRKSAAAAFTLIEMLVVISIIVVLASFAVPAVISGLTKGQMVGTLNNARQLFLAGQQMALDGATNSDPNFAWPGDLTAAAGGGAAGGAGAGKISTLEQYCNRLVQNDYLKSGDLQKILSAPGVNCTVTGNADGSVTLTGSPALKVYKVQEVDPSNTIFAVTANYTYDTALDNTKAPYGDKGFIVMRKGGDASTYKKNQATAQNYSNDARKFESAIGKLPGQADNSAQQGDGGKYLTAPNG
jgi:prepilin-type N-terminal cleavage/methylation domain-containing protein